MAIVAPSLSVAHILSADAWAGAEVATYHLITALSRLPNMSVRAILLNHGEMADRLRAHDIQTDVIPESQFSFVELARRVRSIVGTAGLVHSHREKTHLLASLSGKPWVATQHGRPEPRAGQAALRAKLYLGIDRINMRFASKIIAVSEEVYEWLAGRFSRHLIIKSWNGIQDPADGRDIVPFSRRPMRVGILGRLFPVKGYELAIDAIALCPELELDVVGDGPERTALEARVNQLNIHDRVHFHGQSTDPRAKLESWRALLVTSHHEGNPIGVLEALALGTPVVSANLGGVVEILAGHSGVVVPTRDATQWSETLSSLTRDNLAGSEMAAAGRKRFLDAFTADAAAVRMARIYGTALGSFSATGS